MCGIMRQRTVFQEESMNTFYTYKVGEQLVEAGIANTDAELEGAFRIRFREYVEKRQQISRQEIVEMAANYGQPKLVDYFDRGLEVDYCDHVSTTCIVTVDGVVVACLRLTDYGQPWRLNEGQLNGVGFTLPERWPDTGELLDPYETVEAGRFLASKVKTSSGSFINLSFLILMTGLEACRRADKKVWILAGNVRILEYLREHGWPFVDLMPGEFLYHSSLVNIAFLRVPDDPALDYPFQLLRAA